MLHKSKHCAAWQQHRKGFSAGMFIPKLLVSYTLASPLALWMHPPCSGDEDIVQLVERSMPPNTKLAVFDAITSNTALLMPMAELVQVCKRR